VNDSKRATPTAISVFDNVPRVSKRLKAAFNRAKKLKRLEAEVVRLHGLVMVRVWPKGASSSPVDEKCESLAASSTTISDKTYRSANYRRLTWEGMPEGGCIVDQVKRTCKGLCWRKTGTCLHVIKVTKMADMQCPGMSSPVLRFVSAVSTHRDRSTRGRQNVRSSPPPANQEPSQSAGSRCTFTYVSSNALHVNPFASPLT